MLDLRESGRQSIEPEEEAGLPSKSMPQMETDPKKIKEVGAIQDMTVIDKN